MLNDRTPSRSARTLASSIARRIRPIQNIGLTGAVLLIAGTTLGSGERTFADAVVTPAINSPSSGGDAAAINSDFGDPIWCWIAWMDYLEKVANGQPAKEPDCVL